jgi:hypothetical protein
MGVMMTVMMARCATAITPYDDFRRRRRRRDDDDDATTTMRRG